MTRVKCLAYNTTVVKTTMDPFLPAHANATRSEHAAPYRSVFPLLHRVVRHRLGVRVLLAGYARPSRYALSGMGPFTTTIQILAIYFK